MKCYIASGWFSLAQESSRQIILEEVKRAKIGMYSPKEDGLFTPGMDPEKIFQENLKQIKECDFVIASTEGKDMGTIFECGYAHSNKIPIIYFWRNGFGNFNLMLSQSSHAVCTSREKLRGTLEKARRSGYIHKVSYKGDIE